MSNYWLKRQAEQAVRYTDKTHAQLQKKMAALYKATLRDVEVIMTELFLSIIDENGVPQANDLYRYNKFFKMREELQSLLNNLGENTLKEMSEKMENTYKWSAAQVIDKSTIFEKMDDYKMKALVQSLWEARGNWSETVWCKDGLSSANRIANSLNKLHSTLEKGMLDCVARGAPKDELVKTLQERFSVSFSEADRLARTELTYIQNQANLDCYKKAGIKEYQYLATIDSRTSEKCKELDGKRFALDSAIVGENFPPTHANCRCSTIAVIPK